MRYQQPDDARPTVTVTSMGVWDGAEILSVRGTLDITTCRRLQAPIFDSLDKPPHRVRIDMSAVDFMDSSGLHVLLKAALRAGRYGEALYLRNPAKVVTKIIELTRMERLLPVE